MGQECHCGDLYGLYGSAENCDVPCTGGAKGEICGGLYANSIYQVYTGKKGHFIKLNKTSVLLIQ